MKFEMLIMGALFVVCFTLCSMVLGAMLEITPASARADNSSQVTSSVATTPVAHARLADERSCVVANS